LDPSEIDLRFHQQMAYAVAMRTINAFEQALGRPIQWPWAASSDGSRPEDKLRIYPHDQRIPNASSNTETGELFLGYDVLPGSRGEIVYSCLSFDIVAHGAVHALLASVFPHLPWGVNLDTDALRE